MWIYVQDDEVPEDAATFQLYLYCMKLYLYCLIVFLPLRSLSLLRLLIDWTFVVVQYMLLKIIIRVHQNLIMLRILHKSSLNRSLVI